MCCAEAGMEVVICDVNADGLARGLKLIQANFNRSRRLSGHPPPLVGSQLQ